MNYRILNNIHFYLKIWIENNIHFSEEESADDDANKKFDEERRTVETIAHCHQAQLIANEQAAEELRQRLRKEEMERHMKVVEEKGFFSLYCLLKDHVTTQIELSRESVQSQMDEKCGNIYTAVHSTLDAILQIDVSLGQFQEW